MMSRLRAILVMMFVCTVCGLMPAAASDTCSPERLTWMLEDEKCNDLVFADVMEVMHICDDVQLRVRAADGLARYRGPEVFRGLYRVLESDRSPVVRAAALNALDRIMQRRGLAPGRDIMEAYFLVYQFDRYAPNRARARELLERFQTSPHLLSSRAYVSARYQASEPLEVYAEPTFTGKPVGLLQPDVYFTVIDESYHNNQETCWFSIEAPEGLTGWMCGLRESRENIGTDDMPPGLFESSVRSLAEVRNPNAGFTLELRTGRPDDMYQVGEEIVFFVRADKDCYVTLIYFSTRAGGYILFPNRDQPEGRVRAGSEMRIPARGSTLVFRASAAGVEEISVIATRFPVEIFPAREVDRGPLTALKTRRQDTARGVDRLMRYFDADAWAVAHKAVTIAE